MQYVAFLWAAVVPVLRARGMKSVLQLEAHLSTRLPDLSPAQRKGLAYWVVGTVLAGSACLNAVCSLLATDVAAHGRLRQRLRLWMRDKPSSRGWYCGPAVAVRSCFVPLLRWILSLWQGSELVLALDPTSHRDRVVSLAVRVAGALWARSCALPVAWQVVSAQQPSGSWVQAYCDLLQAAGTGHSRQHARHGAVRPGDCQSAAVGCHLPAGLASLHAVPAAHHLSEPGALWARSPPARAGLGDPARSQLRGGGHGLWTRAAAPLHPGGGVGRADGGALDPAHGSTASRGLAGSLWVAGLDRTGLSHPQAGRLELASHPPQRPRTRGPALAGHGSGHAAGVGLWHPGGGRGPPRSPSLASDPGAGHAAGPHPTPSHQCLSPGTDPVAAPLLPGTDLAGALAAP